MDEMVNPNGMNLAGLFSGMTSSDKTFLGFVGFTGFMYIAKLIFDSVDKAMENGYDATITSTKNGSIRFTHGAAEIKEPVWEKTEAFNANDNEETV